MITVLIAFGPNKIEIVCRLFKTMENGRAYCDPLFAKIDVIPEIKSDRSVYYSVDLEEEYEKYNNNDVSEELLTSFYYGCGGVYGMVLKEIPFNEKFVRFDLD